MNIFNLNKITVINYSNFLIKKYNLRRSEDFDFLFNKGFNITNIKDFLSTNISLRKGLKEYCNKYGIKPVKLTSFLQFKGYKNWSDLISTIGNHRVVKIEYVGKENVYDLVNSSVNENFAIKCNNGMIISHNCTTPNDKGKIMNIYSDSKRIKSILEDLLQL